MTTPHLGPMAVLHQDILYIVFREFAPLDSSWYQFDAATRRGGLRTDLHRLDDIALAQRTLARCARVCTTFFDPAVSVLWTHLDNLEPIMALERDVTSRSPYAVNRRLRYMSYVRAIHHQSLPMDPQCARRDVSTAGLCLMKLRYEQEVPGNMDILPLLSSRLESLHIVFRMSRFWKHERASEYKEFIEALLVKASEKAPNLTYLRVTRTTGIPEAWLLPVCRFRRLKSLDILQPVYDDPSSNNDFLEPLTTLADLHTLTLHLRTVLRSQPLRSGLSFLRHLHLNGQFASLQEATDVLDVVTSPYLESLRIDGCECTTSTLSSAFYHLCDTLHARFAPSFHTLILSVVGIGPRETLGRPLVEIINPILRIRSFRELRLTITPKSISIPLSEPDLLAIAESWPQLRCFHIDCTTSTGSLPWTVLPRLASSCPDMVDVGLPCLDSRGVPADLTTVERGAGLPSYLVSFALLDGGWDSYIPNPHALALFLHGLFSKGTMKQPRLPTKELTQVCRTYTELR